MWIHYAHAAVSLFNQLVLIVICITILVQVTQLRHMVRRWRRPPFRRDYDGDSDDD